MLKIKRQDEVIVLAGKDKGRRGEVLEVLEDGRYLVAAINMVKKHKKANPQLQVEGGIIEQEAPIHGSNLAIYNPTSGKADRVGFQFVENKKIRIYKSSKEPIES